MAYHSFVHYSKVLARRCCQRPLLKMSALSILGLFFFILYAHFLRSDINLEEKLGLAYQLMKNNGKFNRIPGLNNLDENQTDELTRLLRESLNKLSAHCHEDSSRCAEKQASKKPLLTLFSTFEYDEEKIHINNNTLFNWRQLPNVKLVMFSNSTKVQHLATLANWHVMPVLHEATNAPILPSMFQAAMHQFDSHFYGYANADLLFTDDLLSTLESILCEMDLSKSVLVVGKRTNVPAYHINQEEALSWNVIRNVAEKAGSLFIDFAIDYFITTKEYKWKDFLPLAVGRRGYDNWMVSYSRRNGIPVVDATNSILCFHQTLESRGNFEGLTRGDYNKDILEALELPFSYADWGRISCGGWRSYVNVCGHIEILPRLKMLKQCTQYYFTHRIGLN